MLIWKNYPFSDKSSSASLGPLCITCHCGREYKDETYQYSIWLSCPGSDSKEIITVAKIRGRLADAQAEAESLFADLIEKKR